MNTKDRASHIISDLLVNHLPRVQEGLEKGYVDENQILVMYDHAVRARILTEHGELLLSSQGVSSTAAGVSSPNPSGGSPVSGASSPNSVPAATHLTQVIERLEALALEGYEIQAGYLSDRVEFLECLGVLRMLKDASLQPSETSPADSVGVPEPGDVVP